MSSLTRFDNAKILIFSNNQKKICHYDKNAYLWMFEKRAHNRPLTWVNGYKSNKRIQNKYNH